MKRFLYTLLIILSVTTLISVTPHIAHAANAATESTSGGLVSFFANGIPGVVVGVWNYVFEFIILPVAAAIMAITGQVMDFAIHFSLDTSLITGGGASVINTGWTAVRDICNMFFIFVLIWISVNTIFNLGSYDTKSKLVDVIIAALLINFSLFFTKFVIDAGNIFGTYMYNNIVDLLKVNGVPSISFGIQQALGLENLYDLFVKNSGILPLGGSMQFISQFLRLATILTATYVFAYVSLLFVVRTVTIMFLLIFSPIGFVGAIIPKLKSYKDMWAEELVNQALFAPVFLLMLYLILSFINSGIFATNTEIFNGESKIMAINFSIGQYFKYVILIVLLLAALKTAKDLSGKAGSFVSKYADGVGKLAAGGALALGSGGAAILGRSTIGRLAGMAADSQRLQEGAMSNSVIRRAVSNTILSPSRFLSQKASFDMRNVGVVGDLSKPISGKAALGVTLKAPNNKKGENSYRGIQTEEAKARMKAEQEYVKKNIGAAENNATTAKSKADNYIKDKAKAKIEKGVSSAIETYKREQGTLEKDLEMAQKGFASSSGSVKTKYEELMKKAKKELEESKANLEQIKNNRGEEFNKIQSDMIELVKTTLNDEEEAEYTRLQNVAEKADKVAKELRESYANTLENTNRALLIIARGVGIPGVPRGLAEAQKIASKLRSEKWKPEEKSEIEKLGEKIKKLEEKEEKEGEGGGDKKKEGGGGH